MGRSTGSVGGFGSEAVCEGARNQWAGRGIGTGSCAASGLCDAPSSTSPSPYRPANRPGAIAPEDDAAADAARQQVEQQRLEAEQAALKAEEDRRRRQFLQDKQEAERSLKGGEFDGGNGSTLGLKTLGDVSAGGGPLGLKDPLASDPGLKPLPAVPSSSPGDDLKRRADRLRVPPPISPSQAKVDFRLTDPDASRLQTATDVVLAGFEVTGKLAGGASILAKVVLIVGKVGIAGADGAMIYAVRQDALYGQALAYLKDAATRGGFTELTRAIRAGAPLPPGADPEMVRAAQAVCDRMQGNGTADPTWQALMSPEAKRAMLTRAYLEVAGEVAGKTAESVVGTLEATRGPVADEAIQILAQAEQSYKAAANPRERALVVKAVRRANEVLARAFEAGEVTGRTAGAVASIFSGPQLDAIFGADAAPGK